MWKTEDVLRFSGKKFKYESNLKFSFLISIINLNLQFSRGRKLSEQEPGDPAPSEPEEPSLSEPAPEKPALPEQELPALTSTQQFLGDLTVSALEEFCEEWDERDGSISTSTPLSSK